MNVFVSTGAFSGVYDLSSALSYCRDNGISDVELSSGLGADGAAMVQLQRGGHGLRVLLHNYFPAPPEPFVLNLADSDEANRARSVRFCEDALRVSANVGAPFYSVHAGFVTSLRPEDLGRPEAQKEPVSTSQYEEATKRFSDSVSKLDRVASDLGLRLLLENNVDAVGSPERSHLLLVSGEDIVSFFSTNTFDSVGLLMDVAHLSVSAYHRDFSQEDALDAASPWVECFHLSDNDGQRDSNEPCRDESWFWEQVAPIAKSEMPVVLEAYRLTQDQIEEQVALIRSKLSTSVTVGS